MLTGKSVHFYTNAFGDAIRTIIINTLLHTKCIIYEDLIEEGGGNIILFESIYI